MRKTSKQFSINASILSLVLFILIIISLMKFLIKQANDPMDPIRIAIILATIFTTVGSGIMGLIAARIVTKKHTSAGVMLIVCSVLILINALISFTIFHGITITLFTIASVYALKPEQQQTPQQ